MILEHFVYHFDQNCGISYLTNCIDNRLAHFLVDPINGPPLIWKRLLEEIVAAILQNNGSNFLWNLGWLIGILTVGNFILPVEASVILYKFLLTSGSSLCLRSGLSPKLRQMFAASSAIATACTWRGGKHRKWKDIILQRCLQILQTKPGKKQILEIVAKG